MEVPAWQKKLAAAGKPLKHATREAPLLYDGKRGGLRFRLCNLLCLTGMKASRDDKTNEIKGYDLQAQFEEMPKGGKFEIAEGDPLALRKKAANFMHDLSEWGYNTLSEYSVEWMRPEDGEQRTVKELKRASKLVYPPLKAAAPMKSDASKIWPANIKLRIPYNGKAGQVVTGEWGLHVYNEHRKAVTEAPMYFKDEADEGKIKPVINEDGHPTMGGIEDPDTLQRLLRPGTCVDAIVELKAITEAAGTYTFKLELRDVLIYPRTKYERDNEGDALFDAPVANTGSSAEAAAVKAEEDACKVQEDVGGDKSDDEVDDSEVNEAAEETKPSEPEPETAAPATKSRKAAAASRVKRG
jgi:hypothetical protein